MQDQLTANTEPDYLNVEKAISLEAESRGQSQLVVHYVSNTAEAAKKALQDCLKITS